MAGKLAMGESGAVSCLTIRVGVPHGNVRQGADHRLTSGR